VEPSEAPSTEVRRAEQADRCARDCVRTASERVVGVCWRSTLGTQAPSPIGQERLFSGAPMLPFFLSLRLPERSSPVAGQPARTAC